jgi:hypothetical protein
VPHDLASDTRGPSANHLLPGAGTIADELTAGQVRLNPGASVYDPTEPVRRLMFNPLTMIAGLRGEPEPAANPRSDDAGQGQTGCLRGRQTTLSHRQGAHPLVLLQGGGCTAAELAALLDVAGSRSRSWPEHRRTCGAVGSGTVAIAMPGLLIRGVSFLTGIGIAAAVMVEFPVTAVTAALTLAVPRGALDDACQREILPFTGAAGLR